MKLIRQMLLRENRSKLAVHRQQALAVATGQEHVRGFGGSYSPRNEKRIVAVSRLTAPWPEDGMKCPRLLDSLDGEWAPRNIYRGAQRTCESEEVRMTQCDLDRAEASHGDADDSAIRATPRNGQLGFDVRK